MALQLSAMHRDALNELHSSGDEDAGILATIVGFALDSKDGSEDLDQATIDEIERKPEHSQKDPGVVIYATAYSPRHTCVNQDSQSNDLSPWFGSAD